jgi:hypothetical protein
MTALGLINNRRRRFCPLTGSRALIAMFLISDTAPGLVLSFRCPFWAFAAFKALVETTRTLGATAQAVRNLRCARRGLLLISPLPQAPNILLARLYNSKSSTSAGMLAPLVVRVSKRGCGGIRCSAFAAGNTKARGVVMESLAVCLLLLLLPQIRGISLEGPCISSSIQQI